MTRGWLFAAAIPATMAFMSGLARAEDEPPGCPPGEWFCDDAEGEPAPGSGEDAEAPRPDVDVEGPDAERYSATSEELEERQTTPMDTRWSEGSGGRPSSPWALALRAEGLLLNGKGRDTGLGGLGVSGRYSLGPVVTLDLGLDSIFGTDYDGHDRAELTLSLSSLFFLNYHPVIRSYVLVGLNASRARVDVRGDAQTWGYFGGQTGLGLELTLNPRLALSFDIVGFMRGRTDSRAAREPEFTDSLGRVTNTSGGGMLRGGLILRF